MRKLKIALFISVVAGLMFYINRPSENNMTMLEQVDLGAPLIIGISKSSAEGPAIDVEMSAFPGVRTDQPFVDLGSLTKFVTAVAILSLVEKEVLALDTPIRNIFDNVPRDKKSITIHQLLTHTSGLLENTGPDGEKISRTAFVRRLMATKLKERRGEKFSYSNAGYSLLAAIVEIESGLSFEDYLLENFIAPYSIPPIGYQSVYQEDRSLRTNRQLSTWFQRQPIAKASWEGASPGWNLIGNGGAVTTADGFLRFWDAFYNGQLLSRDLVALALTPHVKEGKKGKTYYGYGIVVEDHSKLGRVYWHDGGNDIFSTEWRHLKDRATTYFTAGLKNDAFLGMAKLLKKIQK